MPSARRPRVPQTGGTVNKPPEEMNATINRTMKKAVSVHDFTNQSRKESLQDDLVNKHVDRSKAFAKVTRPSELRNRIAATWEQSVLPHTDTWQTTQNELAIAGLEPSADGDLIDQNRQRKEDLKARHDAYVFDKARAKLEMLAINKYGSVQKMFEEFDDDGSGTISLDEFSAALVKRHLEPLFPREQQRVIFERIDDDHSEQIDIDEFLGCFKKEQSENANHAADAAAKADDFMTRATHHETTAKKKLPPEVQAIKDKLIEKIFNKRRGNKLLDSQHHNTEYLLTTFQQFDADFSGKLSHNEIVRAVGPRGLNLGLKEEEIIKLVRCMDENRDGEVSYKEFIKFLEVHDIDPDYNPFFDSRHRELAKLSKLSQAPWRWTHTTEQALEAFHELNNKRATDNETKVFNDTLDRERMKALEANQRADMLKPLVTSRSLSALKLTMQETEKPAPTCADDIFDDMAATNAQQLAAICPRFVPAPPTDWSRTGYGGNGTHPRSGLYANPVERFSTTAGEYYPELVYKPNQPVTRDSISDSSLGAMKERVRLGARKRRLHANMTTIMRNVKLQEQMQFMNEEQILKEKAHQMVTYFKNTYDKDLEAERKMPPNVMQRKAHLPSFSKMWGGAKDSMFHQTHLKDQKVDFRTVSHDVGKEVANIVAKERAVQKVARKEKRQQIFADLKAKGQTAASR